MYCTTIEGKKSLVRQLGAQLHIDTDPELISGLQRFMNKFHLIRTQENKSEAAKLGKEIPEKVLTFRSAEAYATKLVASFQVSN